MAQTESRLHAGFFFSAIREQTTLNLEQVPPVISLSVAAQHVLLFCLKMWLDFLQRITIFSF
jgi:hypothetical protein